MLELCNVVECLGHFGCVFPSLAHILMKQHGIWGGKYLLKTPGNAISETLNFKMFLDASALKSLSLSLSSLQASQYHRFKIVHLYIWSYAAGMSLRFPVTGHIK